jgi:hypothetical protein
MNSHDSGANSTVHYKNLYSLPGFEHGTTRPLIHTIVKSLKKLMFY